MKYRTKKKRIHQQWTTKKKREANRKLCQRYPFLIPRRWNDLPSWSWYKDKAYSWTVADWMETGWWKAFGLLMCEDLREDLIACGHLYDFRIEDMKEKWGRLDIFCSLPEGSNAWDIIEDYSALSERICVKCGRPDSYMLNWNGWLSPYCKECFDEIERRNTKYYKSRKPHDYQKCIPEGISNLLADKRSIIRTTKDGSERIEFDLMEKANRIRARWRILHGEDGNNTGNN